MGAVQTGDINSFFMFLAAVFANPAVVTLYLHFALAVFN
jgi:hypothetical protein